MPLACACGPKQDGWIEEFIPALEKMLGNGYESSELVASLRACYEQPEADLKINSASSSPASRQRGSQQARKLASVYFDQQQASQTIQHY